MSQDRSTDLVAGYLFVVEKIDRNAQAVKAAFTNYIIGYAHNYVMAYTRILS